MRDGSLHRFSWLFLSGAAAVMFDQQLEQFFLQRGRSQFSHEEKLFKLLVEHYSFSSSAGAASSAMRRSPALFPWARRIAALIARGSTLLSSADMATPLRRSASPRLPRCRASVAFSIASVAMRLSSLFASSRGW